MMPNQNPGSIFNHSECDRFSILPVEVTAAGAHYIPMLRSKSNWQIAFCFLFLQFTNACSTAQLQQPLGEHTNNVKSDATANEWPIYSLQSTQSWRMNLPKGQPFDASGLL